MIVLSIHAPLLAGPCSSEAPIVIIAPHSGATTYAPSVAVRGFLCENSDLVIVKNNTTSGSTVAETSVRCEGESCIYTFAALVRDLAPGTNELVATTPNGDLVTTIEVIRTALAMAGLE